MPLIAKNKLTGDRINITKVDNPRMTLDKEIIVCQYCNKPMFIRGGGGIITHFSHYDKCSCDLGYRKNETPEHLFGKEEIARMLEEQFENEDVLIELEVPLKDRKNNIFLEADVLVTFPMGWRLAHEIQLSNLSLEEIQLRTKRYESIGIDVIWWMGKKVRDDVKNWCVEYYGQLFTIDITRNNKDQEVSEEEFMERNS